jgi:hypothetical protein
MMNDEGKTGRAEKAEEKKKEKQSVEISVICGQVFFIFYSW